MRWPWQKAPVEARQAGYTTLVTDAALAAATSGGDALASAHWALETSAVMYSRAFSAAKVEGASPAVTAALTPAVMGQIGRDLIRRGESLYQIVVEHGQLELRLVGNFSVLFGGSANERDWRYFASSTGPGGTLTTYPGSLEVVHCRYAVDSNRPWAGISPLAWCKSTASLAGSLESLLANEAAGPSGYFLPVPQDPGDDADPDTDPLAPLKAQIAAGKGRPVIVESVKSMAENRAASPDKDWQQSRYGVSPPNTLDPLRTNAAMGVLSACGVPISLATDADGTSQRESWRRFAMGSVAPLLRIVASELARKLDSPGLSFSIGELWASDQAGRAQAFAKLVGAGMSLADAAAASGVLADG